MDHKIMDFVINGTELEALYGLPHIQQLAYIRGIRPYMDAITGIVGEKRKISHQSIAEQLYIEPHPGIKSQTFSRDQVRRAVSGLARAGIIEVQSEGMQLILKCPLASRSFSVQNKAAINPPQKATINPRDISPMNTGLSEVQATEAVIVESPKAATPHKDNYYYIFLYKQFEKFWAMYPVKKSQQKAWQIFQELNLTEQEANNLLTKLLLQVDYIAEQETLGHWVPNWKNPANWLAQQCWNDEMSRNNPKEKNNASYQTNSAKQSTRDPFWDSCKAGLEDDAEDNVISLATYRNKL